MDLILIILGILEITKETLAGYCSFGSYYYGLHGYVYCTNSCCGSYYSRYCCYKTEVSTIVGAVIGSLIFVGIIVGVVVYIVVRNKRAQRGRVIVPHTGNAGVSVVHTSNQHQFNNYQQPIMYQGYNQPQVGIGNTSYQQLAPAYPPPPAYPPGPPPMFPGSQNAAGYPYGAPQKM